MNKEQLQDIFRQPYNAQMWQELLINLFGASEIRQTPSTLTSDSNEKVEGFELGRLYTSDRYEIGLFAFEIKQGHNVQLNRVGLRSLVRSYTRYNVDAALVVYYDASHWRLSFICDIKEQKTAPKRYTYVFGNPNESYRTASAMLAKLSDGKSLFENIKAAFSVEALSRDFFKGYKEQYGKFCKYIGGEPKWQRDYVKKMMGRLVFLQFLQKKGWMGVPANQKDWEGGDLQYIQNLIKRYEGNEKLLSDILEPLFFDTLNTKREGDIADPKLGDNIKIPYLNGGLFDQDKLDEKQIDFPYSYFAELMDFFSQYNFTIDENDPNDAEVGIDPEMLGHIFENLLEDNKDKGAFYTPKEIVQYMCRQSLIEYLQSKLGKHTEIENFINHHDTGNRLDGKNYIAANAKAIEELLDCVKICDPAIGSGAFPMGILNEIFQAKMALDMTLDRAAVKKNIIQNSVYGVDIEQGAVDIARLRFWLSLVVDESEPQPLPNLDYKIMCGNSLLSRYALDMPLEDVFKEYNKGKSEPERMSLAKYKQLVADYTNTSDHTQKAGFRKTIEDIKSAFRTELSRGEKEKFAKLKGQIIDLEAPMLFGERTKKEQEDLKKLKIKFAKQEQEQADIVSNKLYEDAFEWRFEFPQLLDGDGNFVGFDIVIGNPPYVQISKNIYSKNEYPYSEGKDTGKQNLYKLFVEAAYNISNKSGVSCLIVQSSLLCDLSSKYTRELLYDKTRIIEIIEFPKIAPNRDGQVFESALQGTCMYCITKGYIPNNSFAISVGNDSRSIGDLPFEEIAQDKIKKYYPEDYAIPLLRTGTFSIIDKINSKSVKFSTLFESINQGDVNLTAIKPHITNTPTPIKLLRGRSISKFYVSYNVCEYIDSDHYDHLTGKNKKTEFLVCQEVTGTVDRYRLHFAITNTSEIFLFGHTANKIKLKDEVNIKFILGILNSKLLDRIFRITSTNNHVGGYEIRQLPIPIVSEEQQQPFIDLVDTILEAKKANPTADTTALEAQIDQMVYTLYNLTPDEIAIIEK